MELRGGGVLPSLLLSIASEGLNSGGLLGLKASTFPIELFPLVPRICICMIFLDSDITLAVGTVSSNFEEQETKAEK